MIKPQHVELLEAIAKRQTEHPEIPFYSSLRRFVDNVDDRVRYLHRRGLIKVWVSGMRITVNCGVEITQQGRDHLLALTGRDYGASPEAKARHAALQQPPTFIVKSEHQSGSV